MQLIVLVAAALLLTACATAPAPATSAARVAIVQPVSDEVSCMADCLGDGSETCASCASDCLEPGSGPRVASGE